MAFLGYDGLNADADLERLYNRWQRLRRRSGRYFVHRHAHLERWMADAGYRNVHEGGIRPWRVVLYERAGSAE